MHFSRVLNKIPARLFKGPVIQATFLFNMTRNIVALRVERVVARITTVCSTCLATNFSVASLKKLLQKVELGSTFFNMLVLLATLKFVARRGSNTSNISFNLQCNNIARQVAKSVARITGP